MGDAAIRTSTANAPGPQSTAAASTRTRTTQMKIMQSRRIFWLRIHPSMTFDQDLRGSLAFFRSFLAIGAAVLPQLDQGFREAAQHLLNTPLHRPGVSVEGTREINDTSRPDGVLVFRRRTGQVQ